MSKSRPSLKNKSEATSRQVSQSAYDADDFTSIDPELKAEIESQGLAYRWINAVRLQANYGFDRRNWKPYKRKQASGITDIFGGVDPEGYVRRGDLILAVMPKERLQARKEQIQQRTDAQSTSMHNKQQARELRKQFSDGGLKADISEGYEENEE